jgi:hypothetical protein
MRILDAIQSQQKKIGSSALHQIFQRRIAALGYDRHNSLVTIGARQPCQLFLRFHANCDPGGLAQLRDSIQARILTLTRNHHVFQPPIARANRLFHGVQSVQQLHNE